MNKDYVFVGCNQCGGSGVVLATDRRLGGAPTAFRCDRCGDRVKNRTGVPFWDSGRYGARYETSFSSAAHKSFHEVEPKPLDDTADLF